MQTSGQRRARLISGAEVAKMLSVLGPSRPQARPISCEQVRSLKDAINARLDRRSRTSPQLASELQRIERKRRFTPSARAEFQTLLGALGIESAFPIQVPVDSEPIWFRHVHPLKHYRSHPQLPPEADVVIIGAGLTGASAAYHLREAVAESRRVIVLERGSPAGEASGRNAGHFELLPENSVGTYDGLARERLHFLRRCYPTIPVEVLRVEAERQASLVLSFAVRNRDRLTKIIEGEKLACDFSPRGWLYLAHTEREEQAICDEMALATREDEKVQIWSRMKIRQEFGFERRFIGRFVPGDGTYHPAKFVYGILQIAVTSGVELYTGVDVRRVRDAGDGQHVIETNEGTLAASSVIVATNAFTRQLFPELRAICPAQSQISVTEFVPDRCRGRVVTSEEGPVYFNQPRVGGCDGTAPLLLGGGKDRPMRNPSSRRRSPKVHDQLLELRDRYFPELRRRPFSTEWVGPIALTPDQLPAMGFLKPGIIVAAGFNGYGGSYCVAAGQAAADMAISGSVPDWLPEDVFSPQRLLNERALFFGETSNLWCYAASLCAQVREVNRQLLDALEYSPRHRSGLPSSRVVEQGTEDGDSNGEIQTTVPLGSLQILKPFRGFSRDECIEISAIARARSVRKGALLFSESKPANACLVVMKGLVEVSFDGESGTKLQTRLGPSSIVGQMALLDGGCGNGACTVQQDALLLELKYDECYRLLARHSPLAYKFLAALTDAVIHTLRDAERQLKRTKARPHPDSLQKTNNSVRKRTRGRSLAASASH